MLKSGIARAHPHSTSSPHTNFGQHTMATMKNSRGFDLKAGQQPTPKKAKVVCKAADIDVCTTDGPYQLSALPVPADLARLLGHPEVVTGVDIETHSWPSDEKKKGRIGNIFGFYTATPEESVAMARIVQIGWTSGPVGADGNMKKRFVRPIDFVISKKAEDFHHISHQEAVRLGEPLVDVLKEFMRDIIDADGRHGKVVAHNMEFDAGIILHELNRCGLDDLAKIWTSIARKSGKGFCTMCPEAGRWLRHACGEEVGPETAKHTLGLEPMVKRLTPDEKWRLANHHDAGTDSILARCLFNELLRRKT